VTPWEQTFGVEHDPANMSECRADEHVGPGRSAPRQRWCTGSAGCSDRAVTGCHRVLCGGDT
jgi:hypothetical protein